MLFPPSFRRSFVPFTLIVVGVCFGPGHLRANQVGLTVSSGAEACTGGNVCDQQQFALTLVQPTINTLLTATQVSQFDGSSVSASSSGTVQFGSITGLVSANVVGGSNAVEPPGTGLGGTGGSAVFNSSWEDSLVVTSTTLPKGAAVNLLFTMSLDGTLSCTGSASVSALSAFVAGVSVIQSLDQTCNSSLQGSQTLVIATTVGSDLQIEGQLDISANANGVSSATSTATVDPPTSQFFIDSETAGASYTTASGSTYFSSPTTVPEPSSLLLLGSGMLALVGLSIKKALA